MNTRYTSSASAARHRKPSFAITRPLARSSDTISFDYGHGVPSDATHVHSAISRMCQLTAPAVVSASGIVDDRVTIVAPGIRFTSTSGASHAFSVSSGDAMPAGIYPVRVSHYNIMNHPAGNVSELRGSLGPCPPVTIIPDENEELECDPCSCSCGAPGNNAGGAVPSSSRSVDNITVAPFTSSSGGGGVVRSASARYMRFAFAFGSFRGMGNVPGGQPEIVAFIYDASLLSPASLTYKHPLASALLPEGDSVAVNEGFRVFDGAAYTNYMVAGDGSAAYGVGATAKRSEQVHFVSALSKDDSVVCNLSAASYVRISSADDSAVFYDLVDNAFAALITSDGATVLADEKLSIIRDAETGVIRQIWNYWDGLADVVPAADGNGYTIALYLPSQLTVPAQEGQLFTFTGDPFKSFTVSGDAAAKTMTIRERDWSLPESMPDYVTTWTHTEAGWNKATGEDDDIISETRVKSAIEGTDNYQIVTTVSKGNEVASRVCEVFTSTAHGELLLSRTEAYGSDIAQTTTFEYDEAGRQTRRVEHSGAVYETVYDIYGRVVAESSPWAGGQKRLTTTTYRVAGSSNTDPAKVVQSVVTSSGAVVDLRTDTYTYTELNGLRRVECSSAAAGVAEPQLTVSETWLSNAANPHARGRIKMRQEANGVQTHYEYAATSAHGALYTVTTETRVNGAAVPGQSRRTVAYVAANGNTMREETYALPADGETWALLSGVTNSYDGQNRLIGTLSDNGRSTTRTLNCSGQPLTETDEDGVTTTYAYDTARQLVEVIREEIRDGDVVVTPETITSYTYDALGRTLSVRRDVGAMSTTEYTEYDLLGRVVRSVDALGRVTTTSYSADGLTTTVTTPSGTTLITTQNTDGSVARLAGTGQREELYGYALSGSCECVTTQLAGGATLRQSLTNGFGQTVVEAQPNTLGGFIYTRSEYNRKGQLAKQYQDSGADTTPTAPTLYEYDSFGNISKQTLALSETPTKDNSPVTETSYTVAALEDGMYSVTTQTRYNATGQALTSTQKQLISQLSATLENKTLSLSERGLTSTQWSVYDTGAKRMRYSSVPTSNITAETVTVDGFTRSQKDTAGMITTATRAYTASGMVLMQTDGRGNTTTTVTDIAGRSTSVTDAAGNVTTTAYDIALDQPSVITDAQGNTSCYRYDARGRKVAEWGTALQPVCFGYDDADNMTSLTTFRAGTETISSDPSERTDGDTTHWLYDPATGLELSKTYADNSSVVKSYDAFNRLATETDARGNVKTHAYEHARGLLLGTTYSVVEGTAATTARSYAYNHLGQLTQVVDDAGTRTIAYNTYGEQESDALNPGTHTHLITEQRDSYGRSIGYTYARSGAQQHRVTIGYGTDGRIATAGFLHGNSEKQFAYGYLPGSNLLQTLAMPNNMTLTQSYESQRDLLTGMAYHRGGTALVAQRTYTYDTLGRPLTRSTTRSGQATRSDSFSHNERSELSAATLGSDSYSYAYDNIGNRTTATEGGDITAYASNSLNQYTSVGEFTPTFDADGNQTLVKSSTGIWAVQYNAENRPVSFTNNASDTVVECTYDSMGRRATKKVTTNGSVTSYLRYIYRGYLQIAAIDAISGTFQWFLVWDPTQSPRGLGGGLDKARSGFAPQGRAGNGVPASQPIATRPLAIRKDGTWYAYGWDLTKNICEVFGPAGYIRTSYSYTPYGTVIASGDVAQPIQWSSEYDDAELGLPYYNYRHYNPMDGRWMGEDISEIYGTNLYTYVDSKPILYTDYIGLKKCKRDVIITHFGDLKSDKVGTRNNKLQPGDVAVGHYGKKQHPKRGDTWVLPFGTPVRVIYEDGTMFDGKVADVGAYDKKHPKKAKPADWIDVWNPEKSRNHISSRGCVQIEVNDKCPCPATYIEGKCLKPRKINKTKFKTRKYTID